MSTFGLDCLHSFDNPIVRLDLQLVLLVESLDPLMLLQGQILLLFLGNQLLSFHLALLLFLLQLLGLRLPLRER